MNAARRCFGAVREGGAIFMRAILTGAGFDAGPASVGQHQPPRAFHFAFDVGPRHLLGAAQPFPAARELVADVVPMAFAVVQARAQAIGDGQFADAVGEGYDVRDGGGGRRRVGFAGLVGDEGTEPVDVAWRHGRVRWHLFCITTITFFSSPGTVKSPNRTRKPRALSQTRIGVSRRSLVGREDAPRFTYTKPAGY
ncbi:hypothetical protein [Lysobacter enzymogenes]|uniref:hypothetical protein n=1 Tax=Lysobacter enzymogenes TaxID=69 RepID=UPI001114419B|nr:hypothetical protein [Lysobacter enzymogenes]